MRRFVALFGAVLVAVAALGGDVTVEILDGEGKVTGTTTIPLPVAIPPSDSLRVRILDAAGATTSETSIAIPVFVPPDEDVPPPGKIPEWIELRHDRIRIQGALDFTDHVIKNGPWSSPLTWADGTVPTEKDKVLIQAGAAVTLDVCGQADTLLIEGSLAVLAKEKTCLLVTTITILPTGTLLAGDDDLPVSGSFEITIRDKPIDLKSDPGSHSHGISVFGTFNTCGARRTSHVRLAAELAVGDKTIALGAPVLGWMPGDEIILPDTRQLLGKERGAAYVWQGERRVIESVAKDGRSVTLTAPLVFAHLGARDVDGKVDILPHVANVTRSIVIRSENSAGVPGHTQYFYRARVSIKHTAFVGLGRTTQALFSPTNVIGRYPIHFHHLYGPEVVAGVAHGPQFVLQGCVVDGGDAPHQRKWGIGFHDASFGVCSENVVYNTMGAGIITEDGSETEIAIEDNFICRVGGIGQRAADEQGGIGRQGAGIYLKGGLCRVRRNVVANVQTPIPYGFGYILNFIYLGKIKVPPGPGVDPHMDGVLVDGNAAGLAEFADNEAYACRAGLTFWWLGSVSKAAIKGAKESVFKNFTSWNCWEYGVFQYDSSRVTFDGFKVRGIMAPYEGAVAFYGADYAAVDLTIRRADIQSQRYGFLLSTDSGPQTIEGSRICATTGISAGTPWTSAYRADLLPERRITVRGCRFEGPKNGAPFTAIERKFPTAAELKAKALNLVVPDVFDVIDYQGVKGDNFGVFYATQAASYVLPPTVRNKDGTPRILGAPEGKAVAGAVAPCTTVRPHVTGYCCAK